MIRRRSFELPYPDQIASLAPLLAAPGSVSLPAPADPARLVEAALAHGLGAALAGAVGAGTLELAPAERRALGRACAMRAARAEALRRELDELGATLASACGVPAVCVKGPAVVDRLYAGAGERTFGDLDLVVPRARIRDAGRALAALGWLEDVEFAADFAAEFGHELHQRRRRGGVWLHCELHWRIGDDPLCEPLDHSLLAGGARAMTRHPTVLAPAPEVELLVLCVHFLGDRERRLIWIGDIARAAEAADATEWDRCFELAGRLGLSWALHRGLDYAALYAGLSRRRPAEPAQRPAFGPLRAVEELDMRASLHVGRIAALRGRRRLRYLRTILVPTAEGLEGTAGRDGAPPWRATLRHLRSALAGLLPRR